VRKFRWYSENAKASPGGVMPEIILLKHPARNVETQSSRSVSIGSYRTRSRRHVAHGPVSILELGLRNHFDAGDIESLISGF